MLHARLRACSQLREHTSQQRLTLARLRGLRRLILLCRTEEAQNACFHQELLVALLGAQHVVSIRIHDVLLLWAAPFPRFLDYASKLPI